MFDDFDFWREGLKIGEFGFVDIPAYIVGKAVLSRNAVVVDDDDFDEQIGRSACQYGFDGNGDPFVRFVLRGHDNADCGEHGLVESVVTTHGVEVGFDSDALVYVAALSEIAQVFVQMLF